eukprot:5017388-Pleurochrysis_carterae.AAC.1
MSVAPPIRKDLPPKSAASKPSVAAINRASARVSVEVHVSQTAVSCWASRTSFRSLAPMRLGPPTSRGARRRDTA